MSKPFSRIIAAATLITAFGAHAAECDNYQITHPEWLWCDGFESDASIDSNYFDVNRASGRMTLSTEGPFEGARALKSTYVPGEADSGSLKLSLGATPVSPKRFTDRKFDELYWRVYIKTSTNWTGQAFKVSRGVVFAASDWRQAAIGHLWEDGEGSLGMGIDPVSGVVGSTVVTTKYNDFDHLVWLGKKNGPFQIYAAGNRDMWTCVETRMKLNTPGLSDGVMSFAVNGGLQAQATNLNFRGGYTDYGINAILLESFGTTGHTQTQARYFDNFVVSTQPIGCLGSASPKTPSPPTNVSAQ